MAQLQLGQLPDFSNPFSFALVLLVILVLLYRAVVGEPCLRAQMVFLAGGLATTCDLVLRAWRWRGPEWWLAPMIKNIVIEGTAETFVAGLAESGMMGALFTAGLILSSQLFRCWRSAGLRPLLDTEGAWGSGAVAWLVAVAMLLRVLNAHLRASQSGHLNSIANAYLNMRSYWVGALICLALAVVLAWRAQRLSGRKGVRAGKAS